MIFRHPNLKAHGWAVALALFVLSGSARAQSVILHLQNGDRIAGTITSENTNAVTLSTVWIKELKVPLSQIERRETPPAATTAVTNAVVAETKPGKVILPAATLTNSPWYKQWKGDASIGTDILRGATTRELYYARLNATYSHAYASDPKQFFRNIFCYSAEYGKTDGVLSADDMGGTSKTDLDVSRKVYFYNLGGAGYDQIRKIDLHFEDGPGAGYHIFTGTNFVLNGELGGNYQVEDRSDNTRTENFYYRLGEDFSWKPSKLMTLTEKFEFLPRAESLKQFRSRFESNLSYALMLNFSLNLTLIDLYDTRPASGVPPNELQFRTSLGIKF
ncbi:MAG: hypothetical protein JWR26_4422 [Pedosphaera sp.]|nr:hypothetical protein [Pedosphaera sp.]